MDDFRWYERDISPDELRAMLFPSLVGAASSDSIFLGCRQCRFPEAARTCTARGAHVCSLQDRRLGTMSCLKAYVDVCVCVCVIVCICVCNMYVYRHMDVNHCDVQEHV